MNLEAQLLQIIEQHQQQLKEQQKQLEQALQLIQAQNRTIEELEIQQRTYAALQSSDRSARRDGKDHPPATESDFISRFIAKLGEQLKTAITEPFRAVSDWLEHRGFSKDDNRAHLAADGGGRDQKPIESPDRAIDRKTEFSRAISTKFRGLIQQISSRL